MKLQLSVLTAKPMQGKPDEHERHRYNKFSKIDFPKTSQKTNGKSKTVKKASFPSFSVEQMDGYDHD
jgi:hypothetical protein